jgi:pyruvate/2-oxoglutarate dehydrogenase complex dihydrolipoamide dehydrogenase (E3) component
VQTADVARVFETDLVVVGFGSAGMTAAEVAAGLGLRVTVVERGRPGGDCLWTGCVPSKAIIAAAAVVRQTTRAPSFGVAAAAADIDAAEVWRRMRGVREDIARGDDDPARFEALGVRVLWGAGRVVGPHEVVVEDDLGASTSLTAKVILVCTGGRPVVPPIPGLAEVGFLTNETLFDLERVPRRVLFLGGGPIAMEHSQAFGQLGIETTVLEVGNRVLGRDEPELVDQLVGFLAAEGVEMCCGVDVVRVEPGPVVVGFVGSVERRWEADAIVIAAGREVDVQGLGLAALGVVADHRGVVVDERGRTRVPSIYAAGDVVGRELFTHAAAHQAATAVRDAFFPGRGRVGAVIPWAIFTEPTLAHAGLTAAEARDRFGTRRVRVHEWSLDHNDRAHTDRTSGRILLVEHVGRLRTRLVGAHVLAAGAGEVINELVVAIERKMCVADLGGVVHVYPTIATSLQQLGGRAAVDRARRYRWLLGRSGRRSG